MSTSPNGVNPFLAAALDSAARGWPVFPCSPSQTKGESKQPLVPKSSPGKKDGGLYLASTDEGQIHSWWERFPKALIGMPTGLRARLFVVDLDPRKFTADEMLSGLAAFCGGSLPPCPVVRTQSGGLHLWFAYPDMPDGERLGNRAGLFAKVDDVDAAIAEHVDIRGEGGYVILPPSTMVDGARYEWEQEPFEGELSQAPARLLDLVLRRGEFARGAGQQSAAAPSASPQPDEAVRRYGLAALDKELADLATTPPGRRGETLNRCGFALGQLVAAGALSRSMVVAGLKDACDRNGLAATDGWKTVESNIDRSVSDGMLQPRDLADVRRKAEQRAARRASGSAGMRPTAPLPEEFDGPATPDDEDDFDTGHDDGDEPPEDGEDIDWEKVKACAELEQNDTDNGRRLLIHFGDQVVHVRDLGWAGWNGTHYELKGGAEAVERLAQKTAKLIHLEAIFLEPSLRDRELLADLEVLQRKSQDDLSKDDKQQMQAGLDAAGRLKKRREGRRKFAVSCGNSNRLSGMRDRALAHCTIAQDQLDADPYAINLRNGVLDVRRVVEPAVNGVARISAKIDFTPEHDPKRLMSKRMEVDYDPEADYPRWRAFLDRFQPSAEMQRYLQKLYGYCLLGLTAEQSLWFNYGGGSNGKSTLVRTVAEMMGSYATSIPFASLVTDQTRSGNQASPDIALLPRARLAHAAEPPKDVRWDEAIVKRLTGGETMQARGLFQSFFEFRPTHKLIVSGNDKPPVSGVDHGIWRRLRLLPWLETISDDEKRDMDTVIAEFLEESSGILNWLLDGVRLYFDEGLRPPDPVLEATREYRDENDAVGPFLDACVQAAPGESVTAREMYEAYCHWADANGVKPIHETRFGRLLPQKGLRKTNERIRRYQDVRLHDVPEPPRSPGNDWHNRDD